MPHEDPDLEDDTDDVRFVDDVARGPDLSDPGFADSMDGLDIAHDVKTEELPPSEDEE